MKQYLKMADVFGADEVTEQKLVGDSYELKSDSYGHVCVVNTSIRASLIAHAINSHDELVQVNQELLAAASSLVDFIMHPSLDADESIPELVAMQAAIAKTKGGDA